MRWLVLLLLVPLVAAQGAPDARSIDTRVLADTTSSGDYGGPDGAFGGGLDLLALDAYPAHAPGSVDPAILMRVIVQGGEGGTHRIDITGKAGGKEFALDLQTTDLGSYTSDTFRVVRGPFDVGDGPAKAIEGLVALSDLGITGGDVTDIQLRSTLDGDDQDVMPGTWYLAGQQVPLDPTAEAGGPGVFPTAARPVFTAGTNTTLLPADGNFTIHINSTIDIDQVLTVTASGPQDVNVTAPSVVDLPAGATRPIMVRMAGVGEGSVQVLLESDLLVNAQVSVPIDSSASIGAGGDVGSGDMQPGDVFQYTFTAAATFEYHCHPHPWMQGEITIEAGNATPQKHVIRVIEPSSDPDTWVFDPAELTIQAGDTVVWINEGQMLHDIRGSTGLGEAAHDHMHDHEHGHGTTEGKESPGLFMLVPLCAALLLRRR